MTSTALIVADFHRSAYLGGPLKALKARIAIGICDGSSSKGLQMASWDADSSRNANVRRISVHMENKHCDWDLRWKLA